VVEFSTDRFSHRGKGRRAAAEAKALKEAIQTWGTFAESTAPCLRTFDDTLEWSIDVHRIAAKISDSIRYVVTVQSFIVDSYKRRVVVSLVKKRSPGKVR
jgi:hypothetical protein